MNRILYSLCVIGMVLAGCNLAAVEPEKFIPANAVTVARADLNRAVASGLFDKIAENNSAAAGLMSMVSQLQRFDDMPLTDIFSGQVWVAVLETGGEDTATYMYLSTNVPENVFYSMFQRGTASGAWSEHLQMQTVANKTVYMIKPPVYDYAEDLGSSLLTARVKEFAVVYLAGDVLLITDASTDIALAIKQSQQSSGCKLIELIDRTALAALVMDGKVIPPQVQNVKNISMTFNLTGNSAIEKAQLQIKLACTNKAAAQMNSMQFKLMLKAMLHAVFSNDAELAGTMTKALKVKSQDTDVLIDYQLTKEEIIRASQYLQKSENRAVFQPALQKK